MATREVSFKVSSAIKNLIGQELITDKNVAVFELVKNAFDANAKNINVSFDNQSNTIVISDDGCGMSENDIAEKWLFIGFSEKKESKTALYSGSKGIGRFSCDRLGRYLKLTTVKDKIETSIVVDWKLFEENQKSEIQNITLTATVNNVNKPNSTRLEITELKDEWNYENVQKVINQLKRLVSPNVNDKKAVLSVYYYDNLGTEKSFIDISNDVFDYMEDKAIYISTIFSKDGIKISLMDGGKKVLSNTIDNKTLLDNVNVKIFFASQSAKVIFKRRTGQDIVDYGNIFIYKNKFRIYPFGERGYDIFGVDGRKAQGYNRYLGSREIFGWIDIIDNNNNFIEATSRDHGFLENRYYVELKNMYFEYAHKPLEYYIQLVNYGNLTLDNIAYHSDAQVVIEELSHIFSFGNRSSLVLNENVVSSKTNNSSLKELDYYGQMNTTQRRALIRDIKNTYKNKEKEFSLINKQINATNKENKKLRDEIELKNRFIADKKPSRQEILEHDLNQVTQKLNDAVEKLINYHEFGSEKDYIDCRKIISIATSHLVGIRNFLLKTNIDTRNKEPISIGVFIKEYCEEVHKNQKPTITVYIVEDFDVIVDIFDVTTIIENVISNAKNFDATIIDVYIDKKTIKFVTDTFSSNREVDFNRVFDFGYTTSLGGTGMGLYIVSDVANDNGFVCKMYNENDNNVVLELIKK